MQQAPEELSSGAFLLDIKGCNWHFAVVSYWYNKEREENL